MNHVKKKEFLTPGSHQKILIFFFFLRKIKGRGCSSVVKELTSVCKALCLSTTRRKKGMKGGREEGKGEGGKMILGQTREKNRKYLKDWQ